MITRNEFAQIDFEVKKSVNEVFEYIKETCIDHYYILFLADGRDVLPYSGPG